LAVRISDATSASREQVASFALRPSPAGITETSIVPKLASVCGHNFDELV
jgi:hypothetical protein